jgi:serine/threonine protein kinase
MGLFGASKKKYGGCPQTRPVRKEKFSYALSSFELFETLGTGTFGRVRLVRCIKEDAHYALKMVKKEHILKMDQLEHMKNEVQLLTMLSNPFVVDLRAHFQDELRLYLLMELVIGGELYALLRNSGKLSNDRAKFYAAEVVLAFEYLHGLMIAYRSLKPENILIDHRGNIKLVDFGFAKVVEERTFTHCGTPEYCAPEVINGLGHGRSVDWWGLGVLIYEMTSGHPPFFDASPFGIYEKILAGKFSVPPHVDDKASSLLKQLIKSERTKRLGCKERGADELKAHPWFHKVNWDALYYAQVKAPYVPEVSSSSDTRHFDRYPDSEPGVEEPLDGRGQAKFHQFDTF